MSGCLPEILAGDMRRVEKLISMLIMLVFPVIFDQAAKLGSFGLPEDQARPDMIFRGEKLKLFAKAAVISFLGFFQRIQILFEGFLIKKGGTINTLQHIIFFIATPVSASHPQELESLDRRGIR